MKISNRNTYEKIRERVLDLAKSHREQIEGNQVIRLSAVFIGEAEWLVKEIDRLTEKKEIEVGSGELAEV